jgi:hypothetical protein
MHNIDDKIASPTHKMTQNDAFSSDFCPTRPSKNPSQPEFYNNEMTVSESLANELFSHLFSDFEASHLLHKHSRAVVNLASFCRDPLHREEGLDVIRKEAWLFCRASSGVRLCWELEEPTCKGPTRHISYTNTVETWS